MIRNIIYSQVNMFSSKQTSTLILSMMLYANKDERYFQSQTLTHTEIFRRKLYHTKQIIIIINNKSTSSYVPTMQ